MDINLRIKPLSNLWNNLNKGILTYEGIDSIEVTEDDMGDKMVLRYNSHTITIYLSQIEKYYIKNE